MIFYSTGDSRIARINVKWKVIKQSVDGSLIDG